MLKNFGAPCDPGGGFFGLKPWYAYLESETDPLGKCTPIINDGRDIGFIVLAIIDDMLRISALVAVAFVIYGGVQYVLSQGEPEKTNSAKNTILNALVGAMIAITATGIVSYIGNSVIR